MKNDDGVVTARKSGKVMNGYWLLLAIEIFMVLDADARARGWRETSALSVVRSDESSPDDLPATCNSDFP
jgi:hypothetical protein